MNTGLIAQRYAKALLKLVQESDAGEKVYSQACVLVHRMQEIRQLADVIQKHPEVSLEKKTEILDSALGEPMAPQLHRFVSLIHQNRRIEHFGRMLYSFMDQYRTQNNIKVGNLITASPVSGLKDRLQQVLSERMGVTVILEERLDPTVSGGFVLNVGDLRMDASVSAQFRQLRHELIDNDNRIV